MRVSRHRHKRLMSEINVVPYIDVMLVLLVIFMVTAPLMMEGVTIDLPAADAKPVVDDRSEPFVVRIDRDGAYYLNEDKQPVADLNEIRIKAAIVLRNNPKTPFMVEGDKAVAYDAVVQAMVLLQQAGVPLALVTNKPSRFVPELLAEVQIEATFPDGTKLVTVHNPIP